MSTGNISPVDLCKDLLTDRDRLLDEIAAKNSRIVELEEGLVKASEMILCLSRLRGEPE